MLFRSLNSVKYTDWSIVSILEYIASKQNLYADMLDDVKGDIYDVFHDYYHRQNINRNAKTKVSKLLSIYDTSFKTVQVLRFKDKLRWKAEEEEHRAALRMKAASTCTVEDLKVISDKCM